MVLCASVSLCLCGESFLRVFAVNLQRPLPVRSWRRPAKRRVDRTARSNSRWGAAAGTQLSSVVFLTKGTRCRLLNFHHEGPKKRLTTEPQRSKLNSHHEDTKTRRTCCLRALRAKFLFVPSCLRAFVPSCLGGDSFWSSVPLVPLW